MLMIDSAFKAKKLKESSYKRLKGMIKDSDGEDYYRLEVINNDFIQALKERLSERLIIGAEKIEATTDPKEKARLMNHYNNLLKELSA